MNHLSAALRLYTGRGVSAFPLRSPEALLGEPELLMTVEGMLVELGGLEPDWHRYDLVSATQWAQGEMKTRHPDLDEDAVETLGWVFSYDWK
jgi:hypothetical protein